MLDVTLIIICIGISRLIGIKTSFGNRSSRFSWIGFGLLYGGNRWSLHLRVAIHLGWNSARLLGTKLTLLWGLELIRRSWTNPGPWWAMAGHHLRDTGARDHPRSGWHLALGTRGKARSWRTRSGRAGLEITWTIGLGSGIGRPRLEITGAIRLSAGRQVAGLGA